MYTYQSRSLQDKTGSDSNEYSTCLHHLELFKFSVSYSVVCLVLPDDFVMIFIYPLILSYVREFANGY